MGDAAARDTAAGCGVGQRTGGRQHRDRLWHLGLGLGR